MSTALSLPPFWSWLAPLLKPPTEALIATLKADGPTLITEVNALATKNEPAVLALLTKWVDAVPVTGVFGSIFSGEIRTILLAYAATEITSLMSQGETLEQPAFDAFMVKIETLAASIGL